MPREASDIGDDDLRVGCAVGLGVGLGPVAWGSVLAAGRDAAWAVRASPRDVQEVVGCSEGRAEAACEALRSMRPDGERELMQRHGVRGIVLGDADYPSRLAVTRDPPPLLWVRGAFEALDWDAWWVAVVGSRAVSAYGQGAAHAMAAGLSERGCGILSGGARGVDAAAHRAAQVVRAPTVAILGCGLSVCYPSEHVELFEAIVEGGGVLVSELPCDTPPAAHNFPRRNRLLAGMADSVVVVEARQRSGAMITARLACELGREVGFLPGRINDPGSEGCLLAIREGWGALVRGPDDVVEALREHAWRRPGPARREDAVDCAVSPALPPPPLPG